MEYIGCEYEKIIEIYNHQIRRMYQFDTSHTYFDCTNFYFEIDKENAFRRKGPSKENRKEPIVGLGLLLDANQIPVGIKCLTDKVTTVQGTKKQLLFRGAVRL